MTHSLPYGFLQLLSGELISNTQRIGSVLTVTEGQFAHISAASLLPTPDESVACVSKHWTHTHPVGLVRSIKGYLRLVN